VLLYILLRQPDPPLYYSLKMQNEKRHCDSSGVRDNPSVLAFLVYIFLLCQFKTKTYNESYGSLNVQRYLFNIVCFFQ
jgi:hypothetical protein